jgi:hypothetical protein
MSTLSLICTNDGYAPTADEFASVEEFLAMCQECFGEQPDLLETSDGIWTDRRTGERVLARSDLVACELCGGSGKQSTTSRLGQELRCTRCHGTGYQPER